MKTPLVSICCVTYNHAPFIRQCLDGFLMQQPPLTLDSRHSTLDSRPSSLDSRPSSLDSWLEILIHDDCSTDGTTEIIQEYAAKYPNIIKPLYETENQYSKGVWVDGFNYRRAKGKYIAYCEGDDYWTDSLKLQKQVDFMESHPEYSVCFTTFRNYLVETQLFQETRPTKLLKKGNDKGVDIDLNLFFENCYTQPLTMLFRTSSYDFNWVDQYTYYVDTYEIYHLLKNGKGKILPFDGGVRNVHRNGVSSTISNQEQMRRSIICAEELYTHNRDSSTKCNLLKTYNWVLGNISNRGVKLYYLCKIFLLRRKVKPFIKGIAKIIIKK